jgi:nucleotide-binding universal stress UspA family protein
MFKHILVPLDGSELSEKAIPAALQGLDLEGTLTLLNVIDLPDMNLVFLYDMPPVIAAHDNTETLLPEAQKGALEYLRGVVERMQLPPTIKVNLETPVGKTSSVIAERAKVLHVDAIAMSTHGRSGLSRWVFGSVTQRVLGLMPCPVLVVPGQVSPSVQTEPPDAAEIASW